MQGQKPREDGGDEVIGAMQPFCAQTHLTVAKKTALLPLAWSGGAPACLTDAIAV